MCGVKGKECCICYCSGGGCLASMRDDYWQQATKEQLIERINDPKRYLDYKQLMKTKLKEWYDVE